MAGTHAGIVQWFADWRPAASTSRSCARSPPWQHAADQLGAVGHQSVGAFRRQPAYTLASIISGRHDAYIHSLGARPEAFGSPVFLRFAQEMNGNCYPWAERRTATARRVRARVAPRARHLHRRGRDERPLGLVPGDAAGALPRQYPGHNYVDVVALSGFNGGNALPWGGWRTFARLQRAAQSLRRLAPDKPVQISEVGTATPAATNAVDPQMFDYVEATRWIRSVLWFDLKSRPTGASRRRPPPSAPSPRAWRACRGLPRPPLSGA